MREVSLTKEMHATGLTDMRFLYLGKNSYFRLYSCWIPTDHLLHAQVSMSTPA